MINCFEDCSNFTACVLSIELNIKTNDYGVQYDGQHLQQLKKTSIDNFLTAFTEHWLYCFRFHCSTYQPLLVLQKRLMSCRTRLNIVQITQYVPDHFSAVTIRPNSSYVLHRS